MNTLADLMREKERIRELLKEIDDNMDELEFIAETNEEFLTPILRESKKLRVSLISTTWALEETKAAVMRDIERSIYKNREMQHEG